MSKVVVITGAGVGVGHATIMEFARNRHRTAFWAFAAVAVIAGIHQLAKQLDV